MSRTPAASAAPRERRELAVCASADLGEGQHRILPLRFKGEPQTALVLRHQGQIYAYLNQCVHMVRRLDCIEDAIFDPQQGQLRCSMHGIVYDPATGESLSVLCAGKRLEPLRAAERAGQVYIIDKRTRPEMD